MTTKKGQTKTGIEVRHRRLCGAHHGKPCSCTPSYALRDYLVAHGMTRRPVGGFVFGRDESRPFSPSTVAQRATRRWTQAGLKPVTLHECRHTFATLMIAAGVNAKALQTFMGHSSITVTLDRYGHLFPGSEGQAAALLDAYLAEALERGREADPDQQVETAAL